MFSWFLPCPFSFSGWCAGTRIVRPVICFGLLCLLVGVLPVWCLRGVAGSCWPLVVAVVFSSVALLVFALVCGVALAWLALSLLRSPPALPAPSVSPLVPLVQSVLCWSLPLGICMPVAWCVVTAWHLSSPLLKGFGPVWGSLHHVASAVPVSFLPALRYSALGDPDPPQDAARAACALLLGLCCFLLLSLLPPPAPPLFVLLLLASACCLPPRSCSFCEKAPCTDLRSDPTLHQNSYRTTQADAYVNHAHQTPAQSVNSQT